MTTPAPSSGEMPFLDHLEELRWRIIYSLIGIVIGLAIGLYLSFAFNIIDVLQEPVLPYLKGGRLVILHPMDAFSIRIQIAFVIGLTVSAPVVGFQLWAFMAPALHKPEKRVVVPILFAAALLFLAGVALAWFYVLPMSLKWLYGLVGDSLTPMYAAASYFDFATKLALAFGVAFEVPLLLVALSALGILSANTLNKSRKIAILAIFIGAAVVSPGDAIVATIALAVPLYLLYELSVVLAFVIEKRRRVAKAREELPAV
ncbi:MAG: twin-arginine translocase subunit TatC [Gemmatimonadaceae bacterium]